MLWQDPDVTGTSTGTMARLLAAALLTVWAAALVACGSEVDRPSADPAPSTAPSPDPTDERSGSPNTTATEPATASATEPATGSASGPTAPLRTDLPESFSLSSAARSRALDLSAVDGPGFTSPSGNLGCLFDDYRGAHVRCDRLQMDRVPAGKPADCDFDWGHSVELSTTGPGSLACTSDTVMGIPGETDGSRVLPYGDAVRYRGIACLSTERGLLCVNGDGHGFTLARRGVSVG